MDIMLVKSKSQKANAICRLSLAGLLIVESALLMTSCSSNKKSEEELQIAAVNATEVRTLPILSSELNTGACKLVMWRFRGQEKFGELEKEARAAIDMHDKYMEDEKLENFMVKMYQKHPRLLFDADILLFIKMNYRYEAYDFRSMLKD
jgi:hypothetical protein